MAIGDYKRPIWTQEANSGTNLDRLSVFPPCDVSMKFTYVLLVLYIAELLMKTPLSPLANSVGIFKASVCIASDMVIELYMHGFCICELTATMHAGQLCDRICMCVHVH